MSIPSRSTRPAQSSSRRGRPSSSSAPGLRSLLRSSPPHWSCARRVQMHRRRSALPDLVAIHCHDVRKTYATSAGGVEALHAVTAAFPGGGLSALVGPSGCGKSTLLRLLAALDGPDSGSISVAGRNIAALPVSDLRRFRRDTVTYVAQRAAANLVPHLRLQDHFDDSADLALLEPLGLASHVRARP